MEGLSVFLRNFARVSSTNLSEGLYRSVADRFPTTSISSFPVSSQENSIFCFSIFRSKIYRTAAVISNSLLLSELRYYASFFSALLAGPRKQKIFKTACKPSPNELVIEIVSAEQPLQLNYQFLHLYILLSHSSNRAQTFSSSETPKDDRVRRRCL